MCSRALCTVFPCGSTTAFFGVTIIFAFMLTGGLLRQRKAQSWATKRLHARIFLGKTERYENPQGYKCPSAEIDANGSAEMSRHVKAEGKKARDNAGENDTKGQQQPTPANP